MPDSMPPRKTKFRRKSGGCAAAVGAAGIAVVLGLSGVQRCMAADRWGGSLGITSDYLVRGVSRSNDHVALQLDLHYLNPSGFVAGVFASNAQIDPGEPGDVEVSAFVGFAWSSAIDWHGKVLATHYRDPWLRGGPQYDYDELDLDIGYQEWLDIGVAYAPNAPYFTPDGDLRSTAAESAEVSLQRPIRGKLSWTAGIGYYNLDGRNAGGYAYWSAGVAYDLRPLSLAVVYVDTTSAAKTLFYNEGAGGRWTGTVIWRF
jgi:uncharacterized protein (TIGR02001 family)